MSSILRFEVLEAVTMRISVFWDVTPCTLIDIYQRIAEAEGIGSSRLLRNVGNDIWNHIESDLKRNLLLETSCYSSKHIGIYN
jgi:hypothetical protein